MIKTAAVKGARKTAAFRGSIAYLLLLFSLIIIDLCL